MKIVIIFETQKELVIPMSSSNESLEETFLIVQAFASWSMGTKDRGPILRVTSQALGSDDSTLDQSATSIQIILPEPEVTWHAFYKITTLRRTD